MSNEKLNTTQPDAVNLVLQFVLYPDLTKRITTQISEWEKAVRAARAAGKEPEDIPELDPRLVFPQIFRGETVFSLGTETINQISTQASSA